MKFIMYNHVGSANHGCEALVRTIANILKEENTVLISDAPEEEIKYGVVDLIEVRAAITKRISSVWSFLYAYWKLKVSGNYFYMDIEPYKSTLKKLNKEDVLVSIGGDIFCYDNYPKYNLLHQFALKYVDKSILLGCSIEPDLLKDKNLVNDLKSFDLITAREYITLNALQKAGIKHVQFCPDSAFILEMQQTALPDQFIPGHTIGLNISPLVLNKANNAQLIMDNYRKLIQDIVENTDYQIALIPHVVWEKNDDREPLKVLYDEFADSKRVCMIEDSNVMKLKWVISQCAFFVGARTHATIAAYSTEIPTLVLGYSVKSLGIAKDLFGTTENYVLSYKDITTENDLCSKFHWLVDNKEETKRKLKIKNKEYSDLLAAFRKNCEIL